MSIVIDKEVKLKPRNNNIQVKVSSNKKIICCHLYL